MGYLDIANQAPVKTKNYLDIANNAPDKSPSQSILGRVGDYITNTTKRTYGGGLDLLNQEVLGITKPPLRIATSALQGLEGLATGGISALQGKGFKPTAHTITLPGYGELAPINTPKEAIGEIAQTSALIPGVGPIAQGALFMGGQALSENRPLLEVAGKTAFGAGLGGVAKALEGPALTGLPKEVVDKIRDYAGNKTTAVRQGMKSYWNDEVNAYGKSIDSLAGDTQKIDNAPILQNMTQTMVDRKLFDPLQGKWLKPLNKVDSQLIKTYEDLYRKGNDLTTGDIVEAWRNIRDSAPIDTPLGRDARIVANDVLNGAKDQIDSDIFKQANQRYANFKNTFDSIDKQVDVWGNPLETAKGERFISSGLGSSKEARLVTKNIEEKTGQSLKFGKVMSSVKRLNPLRALIR